MQYLANPQGRKAPVAAFLLLFQVVVQMFGESKERLHQHLQTDRLAHVFLRACCKTMPAVTGHGKSRKSNDGVDAKWGFARQGQIKIKCGLSDCASPRTWLDRHER